MRRRTSSLALACGVAGLITLGTAAPASAVSLEQIAPDGTYSAPMDIRSDPTDPDRLFIAERGGRIQLTEDGTTTLFLDQTARTDTNGERGLLSFELAPDFATSGRYYVYYAGNGEAGTTQGTLYVDELVDTGDPASPTRNNVISIPHPGASNHNGGALHFGPDDGHLYLTTGDGGGGGDPDENGQDLDALLGKVLRFDPQPGGGYTVPGDNPFVGVTGADEVWSYGLRNPFRFSFDRATGALLIGDVGQGAWEEVDYDPPGLGAGKGDNFGWDCYEGRHDFEVTMDCPPLGSTTQPVLEYPNPPAGSSAVTGGYVVRDPGVCSLLGRYAYADFYAGDIRSFVPAVPDALDDRPTGLHVDQPSAFGEDASGRIYVVSLSGPVYRLAGSATDCSSEPPPSEPPPSQPPPADENPPDLELGGDAKQDLAGSRRISLTFGSSESATLEAGGEVTVGSGKRRLFGLRTKHRQLEAGLETTVSWKLSKRRAHRCRKRIRTHRRVEARFSFAATDAAGNGTPSQHRSVRLVRK